MYIIYENIYVLTFLNLVIVLFMLITKLWRCYYFKKEYFKNMRKHLRKLIKHQNYLIWTLLYSKIIDKAFTNMRNMFLFKGEKLKYWTNSISIKHMNNAYSCFILFSFFFILFYLFFFYYLFFFFISWNEVFKTFIITQLLLLLFLNLTFL